LLEHNFLKDLKPFLVSRQQPESTLNVVLPVNVHERFDAELVLCCEATGHVSPNWSMSLCVFCCNEEIHGHGYTWTQWTDAWKLHYTV